MIPVIDINTNEVTNIEAADIAYVNRTGRNGSMLNLLANNKEYRMLTHVELLNYMNEEKILVRSDSTTFINTSLVVNLNKDKMVAEFENGKQATISRLHFKNIEDIINKN